MTSYKIYQVDAFTDRLFAGNPAAVIPLDVFLAPETMQAIAAENNLSETAFVVPNGDGTWHIRWFTPMSEVDLCGHATLASAHVLFSTGRISGKALTFTTNVAGELVVTSPQANTYTLDFPARPPEAVTDAPASLLEGLRADAKPVWIGAARDYIVVFEHAATVRNINPDYKILGQCGKWVIVTAPGEKDYDCVSRFFCAGDGIEEDPVTGSAHCTIVPYWTAKTGKNSLKAYQASPRGGVLECVLDGARVKMTGNAVTFLEGSIYLP